MEKEEKIGNRMQSERENYRAHCWEVKREAQGGKTHI